MIASTALSVPRLIVNHLIHGDSTCDACREVESRVAPIYCIRLYLECREAEILVLST